MRPSISMARATSSTAGCSTAEITTWPPPRAATTPRSARLSDSEPPEVKMISSGPQPRHAATRVARRLHGGFGLAAEAVARRGIAEETGQIRRHRFGNPRVSRRGGVVIQVDEIVHVAEQSTTRSTTSVDPRIHGLNLHRVALADTMPLRRPSGAERICDSWRLICPTESSRSRPRSTSPFAPTAPPRPRRRRSRPSSKKCSPRRSRSPSSSAARKSAPARPPRRSARTTTDTCSPPTTRPARPRSSRPSRRRRRPGASGPRSLGRPRRGHAQGRRAAPGSVARHPQRGQHAQPVEDRLPGRDRRRLRAHRLLALQPALPALHLLAATRIRSGLLGLCRVPRPRGLRLRGDTVQLHLHRRQPADGAGAHGQHRAVEAGLVGGLHRLAAHAAVQGRRVPRRGDQFRPRLGRPGRQPGHGQPAPRRRPLHRLDRGLPRHVEDGRQQHRQLQDLPAHRRRDRRQGLRLRPPLRRRRGAGHRAGPRRLRVPGPEVLGRLPRLHPEVDLGQDQGRSCSARSTRSRSARPPTSATS